MKLSSVATCLCLAFALAHAQDQEQVQAQPQPQPQPQPEAVGGVRQRPQGPPGPGIGGLLSGLLGQITQTADVNECPGKCIHALASLICDEVREDVQCPSRSMRCCVERERPARPNRPGQRPSRPQPDEEDKNEDKEDTSTTPEPEAEVETTTKKRIRKKKPTETTTTTTTARVPPSNSKVDKDDEIAYTDLTSSTDPKSCPGVCVAERLSGFCEAILDLDGLCKSDLKCCVAKTVFGSNPPPELIIPGEKDEEKKPGSSTKVTTPRPTTTRSPPRNNVSENGSKCRGTCVTGFFALLCDEIDRSAACPGGGRCCITKRVKERPSRPQSRPTSSNSNNKSECPGVCIPQMMSSVCTIVPNTNSCQKGTVCCQSKEGSNNGNNKKPEQIKERVPPKRKPPPPRQPAANGPDLTKVVGTLINAATGNSDAGSTVAALWPVLGPAVSSLLLGGGGGGAAPPGAPSRVPAQGGGNGGGGGAGGSNLVSSVLPLISTVLGAGSSPPAAPPKRPPFRKPLPTPPPTTTTTTTTTEAPDDRPECPGSCIASYLSFTCFGNAALTDIFKCEKKRSCCAAKAAIKEREIALKRIDHEKNTIIYSTARNDTASHNSLEASYFESLAVENLRPTLEHPITNKYVCGVKGTYRAGRVVGGEDGTPGEWCWQVALINSLNQYLCGGALIGTQWVLTAAHCVTNIVRAGDAIYVRVGDHDLTQKFGSPGAQTLRVATTYIHHNHNSQTLDNDIALLKLHGEADLKEGVCLVCLPARGTSQQAGKVCTVTGYGYMGETGPIPLRVREASVPVVNDNECVRKINAVTEKIFILPASSFCAGGVEGHDACQGDGGGPLVCEDQGYYELTGLVSWGFGCGRKDVPGVYVKTSSFIGWINQIISVNNL